MTESSATGTSWNPARDELKAFVFGFAIGTIFTLLIAVVILSTIGAIE